MSTGEQAGREDAAGQPGVDDDPLIGRVLADTYRVTRLVGAGGMGAVYEAAHVRLPKRFAIKVLHKELTRNQDAYARFQREAELASSLGNRHIVEVVDFNRLPDGAPYMVMEFLEGEGLAARLERRGPLPPREALDICSQVVSALTAAHRKQVVHRDLKPDNIFLCPGEGHDFVKLLDFGVSKIRGTQQALTGDMAMLGTPAYMSPEAARGDAKALDHRADVYALGAVVYEMLTGQIAFGGDTVYEVVTKIATQMPPPVHEVHPGLPEAVDGVVRRALSKDVEGRQDSAAEFLADLTVALEGLDPAIGAAAGALGAHAADLEAAPTTISAAPEPPPTTVGVAPGPPGFGVAPAPPGFDLAPAPPGFDLAPEEPSEPPPLDVATVILPSPFPVAGEPAPPPLAGYGAPTAGVPGREPLAADAPPDQRATDRMARVAPANNRLLVVALVLAGLLVAGFGAWLFLRPALQAAATAAAATDAEVPPPAPAAEGARPAAPPATAAAGAAPEGAGAAAEGAGPAVAVAPVPARVHLKLEVTPPRARVLLDGDPVTGSEVVVPRSRTPRRFEASAPRYQARTVEVVPDEDRVVRITLHRAHARHVRPTGPPPKPRTIVVPPRP